MTTGGRRRPAGLVRLTAAELRKTATLPAARVAAAVASLGSLGITLLNSVGVREALRAGRPDLVAYTSPVEAALSALPLGTVAAVILGVVAVSSEYTAEGADAGGGRQITTSLTATPRRTGLLAAKALAVVLLVLATAAVTIPADLGAARLVIGGGLGAAGDPADLGDLLGRSAGAALYWSLTALLALAITVLTRSGAVPLAVLITNSSLVSASVLLMKVTALARYLPDAAGIALFERDPEVLRGLLGTLPGGLVMAAWSLLLLVVAAVVLARRDA